MKSGTDPGKWLIYPGGSVIVEEGEGGGGGVDSSLLTGGERGGVDSSLLTGRVSAYHMIATFVYTHIAHSDLQQLHTRCYDSVYTCN